MKNLVTQKSLAHCYDAIFLDEAQDYTIDELDLFNALSPRLFAVADKRQRIYDASDPLDHLRSITKYHHELKFHYRCGLRICKAADSLRKGDPSYPLLQPTSQYDESKRPSTVERVECSDLNEVASQIIERLQVQIEAYPNELLGVIAPKREDAEFIGQIILASPLGAISVVQADNDFISFSGHTTVCVCTIHAAKGLEFRAAHLVGASSLQSFRDRQKRMTYTALTRAKTSLTVYVTEPIPGYLDQAINEANAVPDLPALADVFKKKK